MVDIFLQLLQDSLTEFSYDAELAGISYRTELNMHGIQVMLRVTESPAKILSKPVEFDLSLINMIES